MVRFCVSALVFTFPTMVMTTKSSGLRVPIVIVVECWSVVLVPLVVVTEVISRDAGSESRKPTPVAGAFPAFLNLIVKVIVLLICTSEGVAVAVLMTIFGVIVPVGVWVGVGPVGVRVVVAVRVVVGVTVKVGVEV